MLLISKPDTEQRCAVNSDQTETLNMPSLPPLSRISLVAFSLLIRAGEVIRFFNLSYHTRSSLAREVRPHYFRIPSPPLPGWSCPDPRSLIILFLLPPVIADGSRPESSTQPPTLIIFPLRRSIQSLTVAVVPPPAPYGSDRVGRILREPNRERD